MKFIITSITIVTLSISLFSQDYVQQGQKLINEAIANEEMIGISAGFSILNGPKWESAGGFANKETKETFHPGTLTRLASISKPMTAIAIMQLVEQGKVNLDVPIQTYIPDYPVMPEGTITVRHIMQHSAGIRGYQSGKERENRIDYSTLEAASKIFRDRKLLFKPGQGFNYTSYGYVLLGMVIEKASGISYANYLQANIWDKAGMTETKMFELNLPSVAAPYHKNQKGKIKSAKATNLSDRLPGGGVHSTLVDMLKFGDAVIANQLITEESLNRMIENSGLKKEGNGYGMGWYLYGDNPKYGSIYGHNGAQIGSSTFLMILPKINASIVVLSNTSGALQAVSDITIKLFEVAESAQKQALEK